jgi:hypothetical protein
MPGSRALNARLTRRITMVETAIDLGRPVAQPQQVLEVIRGDMRIALAFREGVTAAMRAGHLEHDPDLNLSDGTDDHAEDSVFTALCHDAISNVKEWASDEGYVYDRAKLEQFVKDAMREAFGGSTDWSALEY